MFAEVALFPKQASTAAERVDVLLLVLLSVTGFFAVLIAVLVIYFAVRYRRRSPEDRPPRILGSLRLEIFWTVVPLGLAMMLFGWGVSVYFFIARPPANALNIYVVAKQWMWKIQHPGGQREIGELHVPVGRPIKLTLTSEDVIHSFFVPAFRVKVDVLPNRYVNTWFEATQTGTYRLFCTQFCGTGHSDMTGLVIVMDPADYEKWLSGRAEGSLALEGRKLLLKYQCISCHGADEYARAPVLERLYGTTVHLSNGRTVVADETYIRQSIFDPGAKIVAGWENIMPSYQGQISEEEVIQIIEYLKYLGPGQTPKRIEKAVPPAAPATVVPEAKRGVAGAERSDAPATRDTGASLRSAASHPVPTQNEERKP